MHRPSILINLEWSLRRRYNFNLAILQYYLAVKVLYKVVSSPLVFRSWKSFCLEAQSLMCTFTLKLWNISIPYQAYKFGIFLHRYLKNKPVLDVVACTVNGTKETRFFFFCTILLLVNLTRTGSRLSLWAVNITFPSLLYNLRFLNLIRGHSSSEQH